MNKRINVSFSLQHELKTTLLRKPTSRKKNVLWFYDILCSIAPFFGCQDWGVQMRQSVSPNIHWLLHGRSEFFETSLLHGRSFAKRLMEEPKVILPKENLMQTYTLPRPQQRSLTQRGNLQNWNLARSARECWVIFKEGIMLSPSVM